MRLALVAVLCAATALSAQTTYRVDCSGTGADTLHSLEAVNVLNLQPGDTVLFRRDTTCKGTLQPQGSGTATQPIRISAYGTGALPKILATSQAPATVSFSNQQHFLLDSLDISGSNTYGIHITGDSGVLHNITLRNLNVHDVLGPLKKKESGLIVIAPSKPAASFAQLVIENVRAFNTTQWSGIFVSGPSREHPAEDILIRSSSVHDVQGDGIVLFNAHNSGIYHSLAWHTGMQHQQSIGTPNAIWTWQCDHCIVEGNEAFLVDSPGVDGGAFDIDWGNTANIVRNNFGHDTAGYCVAIFGANGPTRDSVVDNNLCLHNGLSPRLAQRQGAILLMTWGTGTIEGATITNNRVDWHVGGDTPVVQTGSRLNASNINISNNQFFTRGLQFVDDILPFVGHDNRFVLEGANQKELIDARQKITSKDPTASVRATAPPSQMHPVHSSLPSTIQWHLEAAAPGDPEQLARLFVLLESVAMQFPHSRLAVELSGKQAVLQAAQDAQLNLSGIRLEPSNAVTKGGVTLTNAYGRLISIGEGVPSLKELGYALRQIVGEPDYGRLPTLDVHATD